MTRLFVIAVLSVLTAVPLCVSSQNINTVFDSGVAKMEKKQWPEAAKDFTFVTGKDKYYYDAWYNLGLCNVEMKNNDAARA